MQLVQSGAYNIAGHLRRRKDREHSGRKNESEEDDATDLNDQCQQHDGSQRPHGRSSIAKAAVLHATLQTGTGTLSSMLPRMVSACSAFFRLVEKRTLTTTRCENAGMASDLKSAGVQKLRPSR